MKQTIYVTLIILLTAVSASLLTYIYVTQQTNQTLIKEEQSSMINKSKEDENSNKSESSGIEESTELYPTVPTIVPTPQKVEVIEEKGGKAEVSLCFPSTGVPAGLIVAKDIDTGKMFSKKYDGSVDKEFYAGQNGLPTTIFELPAGDYHMKFEASKANMTGYYTEYVLKCIKGDETECADEYHKAKVLSISDGKVVSNVKLCDFYYKIEPTF